MQTIVKNTKITFLDFYQVFNTVEIYEGKKTPPFKTAFATLKVESVNAQQTKAYFIIEYTLKFGLMGKMMDTMMVKSQFSKASQLILDGLKEYSEKELSGEVHPNALA